jgi:diguanylate cyclase (GGDEF)-like protein
MFAHARRFGEPFACVMCDLDRFKTVNDTYGHQAGDEVLKQFAQILKHEARSVDRVGRLGGEEFLLLLPGAGVDAAGLFAERVRKQVEAHTFSVNGGETSIRRTASFGVSAWPHSRIGTTEVLLRRADEALYVAKETGRNRVVRFDSEEFNEHISADDGRDQPGSEPNRSRPTTSLIPPVADTGIRWER